MIKLGEAAPVRLCPDLHFGREARAVRTTCGSDRIDVQDKTGAGSGNGGSYNGGDNSHTSPRHRLGARWWLDSTQPLVEHCLEFHVDIAHFMPPLSRCRSSEVA